MSKRFFKTLSEVPAEILDAFKNHRYTFDPGNLPSSAHSHWREKDWINYVSFAPELEALRTVITPQERFAKEWNVDIDRVAVIVRLGNECASLGVKECNGDPHPRNPDKTDKNKNAQLWGHDRDVAAQELLRYAESYGFTGVEFNGLYPSLKKGEIDVPIPYE